jgi:prepilin-type N-terminal cleavage/methylation domain-containing protein
MKRRSGRAAGTINRQRGFTLVELMVVVAILGILAVTAVPLYRTWLQRAYGSEAKLMMKKLMDGQILYYLEHNDFFPEGAGNWMVVPDTGPTTPASARSDIETALKIPIPQEHRLGYTIVNYGQYCAVTIKAGFSLYERGYNALYGEVQTSGEVRILGILLPP